MAWLVIAPVEGIGEQKIVYDGSWKGWPKVKGPNGQVIPDQKYCGKYRYKVVGESPDGKSIPEEINRPARKAHVVAAPPEVIEIAARKAEPVAEVEEVVEEAIADPNAVGPRKPGRPRKNV